MSTATAVRTPAEVMRDYTSQCKELDAWCMTLAKEGLDEPDAQLVLFAKSLGFDKEQLRRELGRCRNVLELQAAAGTAKQRQTAKTVLQKAEAACGSRGAELRQQIAKAQAELNVLNEAQSTAQRVVDAQEAAVVGLRGLVPDFVKQEHEARRMALKREIHTELGESEGRLASLEQLLKMESPDASLRAHRNAELACRALKPSLLTGEPAAGSPHMTQYRINRSGWAQLRKDAASEVPGLQAEITRLKSLLAERTSELGDELLDYYID